MCKGIIGHLIPAGTGVYRYHDVEFMVDGVPMASQIDTAESVERDILPASTREIEEAPAD